MEVLDGNTNKNEYHFEVYSSNGKELEYTFKIYKQDIETLKALLESIK